MLGGKKMIKVQANEGGKQSHMDAGAVRFYCYSPGLIQGSTTAMLYYAPTPVAPGDTIHHHNRQGAIQY